MLRPSDTLLGSPRGSASAWKAAARRVGAKRLPDVNEYIDTIYQIAPHWKLDPSLLIAQAFHETGNFGALVPAGHRDWWSDRLNPAGIGITGDPTQNEASYTWPSGKDAAKSQIAHMLLYTTGKAETGFFNPREAAYREAFGTLAVAKKLGDLGAGKWAADPFYAQGIVERGNSLIPDLPDQGASSVSDLNMTKGLIPLPDHIEDFIDVGQRDKGPNCRGYDFLGTRPAPPKFLVLHKSQNEPDGSNSGYFHQECCPALTDWEVVAATGQMRRFVKRGDAPSGWANGVVSAPYGDALAWLNQHGWDLNSVNRDGEAIEITGYFPSYPVTQDTPVSEAAWRNIAQWIASRAHDYGITHETFPLIPAEENRSYITWHQEWTIGTGKTCPGPIVMNYTPTLIERVRAIMKAAQTGKKPPKPPVYAEPKVPSFVEGDLKQGYPEDHTVSGLTYYGALRTYEAIKAANRLQGPDPKAPKVGPRLAVRERFRGMYVVTNNKRHYVVTPYGTYIDASALTPRVAVRKA